MTVFTTLSRPRNAAMWAVCIALAGCSGSSAIQEKDQMEGDPRLPTFADYLATLTELAPLVEASGEANVPNTLPTGTVTYSGAFGLERAGGDTLLGGLGLALNLAGAGSLTGGVENIVNQDEVRYTGRLALSDAVFTLPDGTPGGNGVGVEFRLDGVLTDPVGAQVTYDIDAGAAFTGPTLEYLEIEAVGTGTGTNGTFTVDGAGAAERN